MPWGQIDGQIGHQTCINLTTRHPAPRFQPGLQAEHAVALATRSSEVFHRPKPALNCRFAHRKAGARLSILKGTSGAISPVWISTSLRLCFA